MTNRPFSALSFLSPEVPTDLPWGAYQTPCLFLSTFQIIPACFTLDGAVPFHFLFCGKDCLHICLSWAWPRFLVFSPRLKSPQLSCQLLDLPGSERYSLHRERLYRPFAKSEMISDWGWFAVGVSVHLFFLIPVSPWSDSGLFLALFPLPRVVTRFWSISISLQRIKSQMKVRAPFAATARLPRHLTLPPSGGFSHFLFFTKNLSNFSVRFIIAAR